MPRITPPTSRRTASEYCPRALWHWRLPPSTSIQLIPTKQSGLTLIEILIALLVLSIGLIGIAALNLVSLQNAHSSYHSSLASSIALDFEERLWLRVGQFGAGACITQADADAVATELQRLWRGGNAISPDADGNGAVGHVEIPGVTISAGSLVSTAGVNSQAQAPLTISWADQRFADDQNTFRYLARVPCFDPDYDPSTP